MNESRRGFLKAAGLAALASGLESPANGESKRRLNLLWIMTDQQPLHLTGAYGEAAVKTPNMDRIAREGARFDRYHIAAFPCSPSRACLMTGRYSHNHGVITNDVPLAADVPALGDVLKQAGYRTGHIGKWHLSGSMYRGIEGRKPFDGEWYFERVPDDDGYSYEKVQGGTGDDASQHGFDFWAGGWKQYHAYLREVGMEDFADSGAGNHNDAPSGPEGTHIYSKLGEEHHMAAFFAKEAEAFLEHQKDAEDPFGLVVSFYGPHLPVAPPQPWDTMYPLEDVPLPENHRDTLEGKPARQRANRRCYKYGAWNDEQFRDYVRRYWGYCSYIDHQVGRILDALEASGKADNTIVLFTTDHGDMAAAHGFVFKLGHCGYDELLRVPFLMRCPGVIPAGMATGAMASSVDVLPTLLEIMELPKPEALDGRSFAHLFDDPKAAHRNELFCASMGNNITLVNGGWKFVLNYSPRDIDELYDIAKDPGEMSNLAEKPAHAETVHEMRGRILAWLKETGHPYADVIARKAEEKPKPKLDLWPEITDFHWDGGNTIEYRYTWHAVDAPPHDQKYWSFTHFKNPKYGKDGDIVFRDTTWPEPPTTGWKPGEDYSVGPVRVSIPDAAGPGVYDIAIGLHNPEHRSSPGDLLRGQGNSVPAGKLTIGKHGGEISKVDFKKAK